MSEKTVRRGYLWIHIRIVGTNRTFREDHFHFSKGEDVIVVYSTKTTMKALKKSGLKIKIKRLN